jgi:DUF1365 family protein
MNEKIHEIIDLCMGLENGVTHAFAYVMTYTQSISVDVWEGDDLDEKSRLYEKRAYYDGEFKNEQAIKDIIQALKDLLEEQKAWKG